MKTDTNLIELTTLFPAAFRVPLAFNAEMCRPDAETHVQCLRTLRLFPLEGFAFATEQDERNALWLLNWMHWAHRGCGMDTAFRPPLVVVEGPPASGKTTFLKRLVEIAEVPGGYAEDMKFPRQSKRLQEPLLIFEGFTMVQLYEQQFELLGILTAETYRGRLVRARDFTTITLRNVMVFTSHDNQDVPLPPELQRRTMFIRLRGRDETEAR